MLTNEITAAPDHSIIYWDGHLRILEPEASSDSCKKSTEGSFCHFWLVYGWWMQVPTWTAESPFSAPWMTAMSQSRRMHAVNVHPNDCMTLSSSISLFVRGIDAVYTWIKWFFINVFLHNKRPFACWLWGVEFTHSAGPYFSSSPPPPPPTHTHTRWQCWG